MTVDRPVDDHTIELLRAALPSHQDTQDAAYRAIDTASAELGLELSDHDARHLARAVVHAVEAGIHLRGVELAYIAVDRWANDTDRHLIQPATDRAANDPFRAAVLTDLQQQYQGIREIRREVAALLVNLGHRWLARQRPQPVLPLHHSGHEHVTTAPHPAGLRTS